MKRGCEIKFIKFGIEFIKRSANILLFIFVMFMCSPVYAEIQGMSSGSMIYDIPEFSYDTHFEDGQIRYVVYDEKKDQYIAKKSADKNYRPGKDSSGFKYYVIHSGYIECYKRKGNVLISVFEYDKDSKTFLEFKYNGIYKKMSLDAKYRELNEDEFEKLDSSNNVISVFSRKKNPAKYWFEYNPDGSLKTKHLTRYLPYGPVKTNKKPLNR